jgi:hypothetical protein
MKDALASVYARIERFSRLAIFATILTFALLRLFDIELNLSAQVTIALIGLLIGIPHGAIDHLISIPSISQSMLRSHSFRFGQLLLGTCGDFRSS